MKGTIKGKVYLGLMMLFAMALWLAGCSASKDSGDKVRVWVLLVYRMMEELSSLIKVIQLIMAPESTPDIIMGTVTFTKDFVSVHPRLMAASSTLGLI